MQYASDVIERRLGPGRYVVSLPLPWDLEEEAEVLVTTREGWPQHDEADDPRWTAYAVGKVVLAIRLMGGLPRRSSCDSDAPAMESSG